MRGTIYHESYTRKLLTGSKVAHASAGKEESCFFPQHLGSQLLQFCRPRQPRESRHGFTTCLFGNLGHTHE